LRLVSSLRQSITLDKPTYQI